MSKIFFYHLTSANFRFHRLGGYENFLIDSGMFHHNQPSDPMLKLEKVLNPVDFTNLTQKTNAAEKI